MTLPELDTQLKAKRAEGRQLLDQIQALQAQGDLDEAQTAELAQLNRQVDAVEATVSDLSQQYSAAALQAASQTEALDPATVMDRCLQAKAPELAAKALKEGWSEDRLAAELTNIDRIRSACTAAGWPADADRYIALHLSAAQVQFVLAERKATLDQQTAIDTTQPGHGRQATIDTNRIYAQRRKLAATK